MKSCVVSFFLKSEQEEQRDSRMQAKLGRKSAEGESDSKAEEGC